MTVKEDIKDFLKSNGQSTANEIADGIDYSQGYTREKAKELVSDGDIEGAKTTRVPAVIIKGNYEVLTGNRDYLLGLVKRYAHGRLSHAKSLSTEDLQEFIREKVASDVVGGPFRWEFWMP